jgi:hypothetical protein
MNDIWPLILAGASAIVLLANAAEKIGKAIQLAKAPNAKQDERIEKVEKHLEEVDHFLEKDKKRLDGLEEGNRATQRALIALLDHGIDGNNIKQMQDAKTELMTNLINR